MFIFDLNNCKLTALCDTILNSDDLRLYNTVIFFPYFLMPHGILLLALLLYPIAAFLLLYQDHLSRQPEKKKRHQ